AKRLERSVLVTDASSPAGAKPGRYQLGEQQVDLTEDYRVVLAGGDRLAGSALRMDHGVRNLMRFCDLTLAEAVTMATTNAARAGAVPDRQNGLTEGDRSDFVLFRFDETGQEIDVVATYVGGERLFG